MFSCFTISDNRPTKRLNFSTFISKENCRIANIQKELGNKALKKGKRKDYFDAIKAYTVALSFFLTDEIHSRNEFGNEDKELLLQLLSNRSFGYTLIHDYEEAEMDAKNCLLIDSTWMKGYFRLGDALYGKREFRNALEAYEAAYSLSKQDLTSTRISKTRFAIENWEMGFVVHQIDVGKELCEKGWLTPIQNLIFDYARQMRNFVYAVEDLKSRECVVIDACWDIDGIIEYAKRQKIRIVGAILTHYHIDHCGGIPPTPFDKYRVRVDGIAKLLDRIPLIKAYLHEKDLAGTLQANPELLMERVVLIKDGVTLKLPFHLPSEKPSSISSLFKLNSLYTGLSADLLDTNSNHNSNYHLHTTEFKFIHTPGHTPGSQCVLVNNIRLFTGDTIFPGSCGRIDFPDSSAILMRESLQKISQLDGSIVIYPGHNYGGEFSTIQREKIGGYLNLSNFDKAHHIFE